MFRTFDTKPPYYHIKKIELTVREDKLTPTTCEEKGSHFSCTLSRLI